MEPQKRPPVWEEDALVPELVDRLEYQDAELARLRGDLETLQDEREKLQDEREKLRTDLVIAERWVHTLAKELELADAQLKELRPLYSRIGKPLRPV
jgi:chromosome segregation ATPase